MPRSGAGAVEDLDLLRRERRRVAPDALVRRVREAVFRVELQLVQAQLLEQVEQLEQRRHGGHAVAADVEHVAARAEVRPVAHAQQRQLAAALADDLPEQPRAPVQAARVARRERDAARRDLEREALGGKAE